ncbi:TetR/AcrR family transcriptional regulator [Sphingomonas faeni]|uniref:TetR/AcrR family transcriptional regulator n=1 Tax=Sphingomonas faeni TaxID=185950 RepID=UPI0024133913|nr:TetR/AcrR family transcriptional regulator [Sphingomonas faeni]
MAPSSTARTPRKDAQENRAHILVVAGQAFDTEGIDVSMDAIARQAGVGSATLYRNFPNKDALLFALLAPHHHKLMRERAAIEEEDGHSGRKLQRWIDALGDWMLAYDGLSEPLRDAWSTTTSPLRPTCANLIEITDRFLRGAQTDGFAQPDFSGQDIFLGALAIAWASGRSTTHPETRNVLRNLLRNGWAVSVRGQR